MRDILNDLERWMDEGQPVAIATVISTWGSSPRPVGANMAVTRSGEMAGSVSGGCVEGAVVEAAIQVLRTDRPALLHFGVSDETALAVGLACGGEIEVFVRPLNKTLFPEICKELKSERAFAQAVIVRGSEDLLGQEILLRQDGGITGSVPLEIANELIPPARLALEMGQHRRERLTVASEKVELFVQFVSPPPKLVVVGGVHISLALISLAKILGYHTVIIDPRRAFGNQMRFPQADEVIQAWPDTAFQQVSITPSTAVVMVTHDPKIDDPALRIALTSPAFYVGALGSRKTQALRKGRMLEAGLTERRIARLHGPVGLDIGARSPEEIALAIMAEIVAARNRRPAIRD
jgi:xanthine dehydrogenase accessory factor